MSSDDSKININLPSMNCNYYGCAAVAKGARVYVMGGFGQAGTAEMYDITTQEWIAIDSMSTARVYGAAVSFNDKKVIMGGYDGIEGYDILSSVEQYDPISSQWTSFPLSMNEKWERCAAAVVDGKIIAVGGEDNAYDSLSSAEEYNPETETWNEIPPMILKHVWCAAAILDDGQLYVVGGHDGNEYLSSAEVYNPTTKRWTLINNMSTACSGCTAVSIGDKLFVIGGYDGRERLLSCEVYDAATCQWTSIPSMHTKRTGCATVEVEQMLFVLGGYDGTNRFSSVECLHFQSSPPQPSAPPAILEDEVVDQACASQLPPTMDFIPVATEVIPVADTTSDSQSVEAIPFSQDLSNVSTEEICSWLSSRHGITSASLDILSHEDIDGVFLFTETFGEIKQVLKEEGITAGQISRIRRAIEEAKRVGSLN